jgi:WD40 repeat protein
MKKSATVRTIPGKCENPCITSDSNWLVSYKDNELYFTHLTNAHTVKIETPRPPGEQYLNRSSIARAVLDPTAHWLLIMRVDGAAALYDLTVSPSPAFVGNLVEPRSARIPYDNHTTHKIAFSPDGLWVVLTNSRNPDPYQSKNSGQDFSTNALLWKLPEHPHTGDLDSQILNVPNGIIHSGVLTTDYVIITTTAGGAAIWRLPFNESNTPILLTGGKSYYPLREENTVNAYASPDGCWLLTFSRDEAFAWDLKKINEAKAPSSSLEGEPNGNQGYYAAWERGIFSEDSHWLALIQKRNRHKEDKDLGGPMRTVVLVNLKSGQPVSRALPFEQDDTFNILRFSNEGKWLATGGKDDLSRFSEQTGIKLWDLTGNPWGEKSVPLLAHNTSIDDFLFSQDGQSLFSSSLDRAIVKWQLNATDPARNFIFLQPPTDVQFLSITSLFPGSDGTSLLAATKHGNVLSSEFTTIDRWLLTPESIRSNARRIIGRNLSTEEWRKYFGGSPYEKAFETIP